MSVIHIVAWSFRTEIHSTKVAEVCQEAVTLPERCIHPKTGKPYVKSHGCGKSNSIEPFEGGLTHAFVYEFESAEDRDYYVKEDPAHDAFKRLLVSVVADARVVDYTPGVF